jgi:hypothetical protein
MQYTGRELCSHFAYRTFDVIGDSVVAFCGMCWVETDDLVDLTDRKRNERIFSHRMLHFMIEHFDRDLLLAVHRQRIFCAILQQEFQQRGVSHVVRRGDDLFVGSSKLSVSIATLTPVSTMIHFGVNIVSDGTPVKTMGLKDFKIDARAFALAVMDSYRQEIESMHVARCKARAVP